MTITPSDILGYAQRLHTIVNDAEARLHNPAPVPFSVDLLAGILADTWRQVTRAANDLRTLAMVDDCPMPDDCPLCPPAGTPLGDGPCGNPNQGSTLHAPCDLPAGHEGNHTNGYSEWTHALGHRHSPPTR